MLRVTVEIMKDRQVIEQLAVVHVANVTELSPVSDYVCEARVRWMGEKTTRVVTRVKGHVRARGALLLCARVLLKLAARLASDTSESASLAKMADLPVPKRER